jgi:hypothetical protein
MDCVAGAMNLGRALMTSNSFNRFSIRQVLHTPIEVSEFGGATRGAKTAANAADGEAAERMSNLLAPLRRRIQAKPGYCSPIANNGNSYQSRDFNLEHYDFVIMT